MSVLDNLKAANATAKASGTFPIIKNSANGKFKNLKLFGKSMQNGMPTPANPIDIVTAGSGGNIVVKSCKKNLLKFAQGSTTSDGIDFIVNDGIVTVNGTATEDAVLLLTTSTRDEVDLHHWIGKNLILSGCPKGGSNSTYRFQFWSDSKMAVDTGNGATLDLSTIPDTWNIAISILKGTTVNNLTFYPMLRSADFTDATFEPYTETIATISTPEGSASVGDVRDEIIKYADGSGKNIQRVGKIYSRNVSVVYTSSIANPNGNVYVIPCSSWEKEILWTHRNKGQSISTLTKNQYYVGQNDNSASGKVIYFISDATTTESALAEIQAENSEIYYILLNPIETALSAAQMLELNKLRTFDSITCVSNDAGAEMEIEYFKNSKIGQEMSDIHAGVPRFILDGTTLNIIV